MKYAFHPDAEIEFDQAIEYYEQCAKGLGYDFSIEENDGVFIVAVMHLHREPDYWKDRLTKG